MQYVANTVYRKNKRKLRHSLVSRQLIKHSLATQFWVATQGLQISDLKGNNNIKLNGLCLKQNKKTIVCRLPYLTVMQRSCELHLQTDIVLFQTAANLIEVTLLYTWVLLGPNNSINAQLQVNKEHFAKQTKTLRVQIIITSKISSTHINYRQYCFFLWKINVLKVQINMKKRTQQDETYVVRFREEFDVAHWTTRLHQQFTETQEVGQLQQPT